MSSGIMGDFDCGLNDLGRKLSKLESDFQSRNAQQLADIEITFDAKGNPIGGIQHLPVFALKAVMEESDFQARKVQQLADIEDQLARVNRAIKGGTPYEIRRTTLDRIMDGVRGEVAPDRFVTLMKLKYPDINEEDLLSIFNLTPMIPGTSRDEAEEALVIMAREGLL